MSPKSTIYNQFFLTVKVAAFFTTQEKKRIHCVLCRPRGLMDKASDFGSEDSRFESWRGRAFYTWFFRFV